MKPPRREFAAPRALRPSERPCGTEMPVPVRPRRHAAADRLRPRLGRVRHPPRLGRRGDVPRPQRRVLRAVQGRTAGRTPTSRSPPHRCASATRPRLPAPARFMREVIGPRILPPAQAWCARTRHAVTWSASSPRPTTSSPRRSLPRSASKPDRARTERGEDGSIRGTIRGTPTYREARSPGSARWLAGLGRRWDDFASISVYSDSSTTCRCSKAGPPSGGHQPVAGASRRWRASDTGAS